MILTNPRIKSRYLLVYIGGGNSLTIAGWSDNLDYAKEQAEINGYFILEQVV